jgi:hypothetical protein
MRQPTLKRTMYRLVFQLLRWLATQPGGSLRHAL